MTALPEGWGLILDRSVQGFCDGTVLAGGRPGRLVTLTPAGARALEDLLVGRGAPDAATRALAGRLVAAGMAHPRPPARPGPTPPLTVVVPVRDRSEALARCLAALGGTHPVVVVDDASADPAAVDRVCRAHGARRVHREANGGPGAARTTGMAACATDLVAFVDSDVTVPPGWLDHLTWCFEDPSVAAVAPRVHPAPPVGRASALDRFLAARSPLDMGPDEGPVRPDAAVRYVPTAALVVRRAAVEAVGGFDADLRVGEDVDLLWRLAEAGWQVRYRPGTVVAHTEPDRWASALARRTRYGTSAGPLAVRHPGRLAPVALAPLPTAAAVAALAGRPTLAAGVVAGLGARLARRVGPSGIPAGAAAGWAWRSAAWTAVGLGRASTLVGAPGLVALAASGRRGRRAAVALAVVPALVEWATRRPRLDPVRWTAACLADDLAYGAGVWRGALTARTAAPLLPGRPPAT